MLKGIHKLKEDRGHIYDKECVHAMYLQRIRDMEKHRGAGKGRPYW
jgi:hypothetical protein